jgi:hypothetical protein
MLKKNAAAVLLALAAAALIVWMSWPADRRAASVGAAPAPILSAASGSNGRVVAREITATLGATVAASAPAARGFVRRFDLEAHLAGGLEAAADDSSAEGMPAGSSIPPRAAPQPAAPPLPEAPPRPRPEGASDDEGS